ncbi:MAG: hypothetical protein Phog2KO_43790 [Phototrophicaceae bacterium]
MRLILRILTAIFILNILAILSVILLGQQSSNSVIAYAISETVRDSSVQLIDTRTGHTINLGNDVGEGFIIARSPMWSPDGERIAFWTIHNRSNSLAFEIELDSYTITNLTEAYDYFSMPVYGANNQALYAPVPTASNNPIFLVNETYPNGEQIIASTMSMPQWSPDGRYIAYLNIYQDLETGETLSSGLNFQDIDLYILDTQTSETINYTSEFDNVTMPFWSPDGTQIAFMRATQLNSGKIYLLELATGEIEEIPTDTNAVGNLVWSPDANYIAFTSTQAGNGNETNGEVMILDMRSYEMQNISQAEFYDTEPTWSPDSQFLAFVSRRDGQQNDIYIANIATGELRQLTYTSANEGQPFWRPR